MIDLLCNLSFLITFTPVLDISAWVTVFRKQGLNHLLFFGWCSPVDSVLFVFDWKDDEKGSSREEKAGSNTNDDQFKLRHFLVTGGSYFVLKGFDLLLQSGDLGVELVNDLFIVGTVLVENLIATMACFVFLADGILDGSIETADKCFRVVDMMCELGLELWYFFGYVVQVEDLILF